MWKLDSERGWLSDCITCVRSCMCVCLCLQESILARMTHSVFTCQQMRQSEVWKQECFCTLLEHCTNKLNLYFFKFFFDLLCFSTLMLRLDFNKVPKAEETKKWKVWLDTHLLISSLWVSLVCLCVSPFILHAVLHCCTALLCGRTPRREGILNTPWMFFRLFSDFSKCKNP